jgi:hypothetical protein
MKTFHLKYKRIGLIEKLINLSALLHKDSMVAVAVITADFICLIVETGGRTL